VYILLYIDNILIVGCLDDIAAIKQQITAKWKYKDLGLVITFIGFQIIRDQVAKTLIIY
ncbi:hypothetical protein OIDMADRAFT_138886, partial [Oidiodendron maius Zn]